MILYRCGTTCPVGEIPPSNWATNSVALEYFIDQCDERGLDCGETIFVIEIPAQSPADIGPYCRINGRATDGDPANPFGDDKNGWGGFNRPYHDFRVMAEIKLASLRFPDEVDELDARFKPQAEWPEWLKHRKGV